MKRILITPTFRPHFPFNREFLETWAEKVEDAASVAVHFIVSREELADMNAVLAEFPSLDLHAHSIEDLIGQSGEVVTSAGLLAEVGKFAFQALKKLYALKTLSYDQALVIDSESMVLKPVRMNDVFDEYFAAPFVFYSDLEHRGTHWIGSLSDVVTRNAAALLRIPYPQAYLLEYYGWFYDKQIVMDMFAALRDDLLPSVRKRLGPAKDLFECVIYYGFIQANPERYHYRFQSVNALLRSYLGDEGYRSYIRDFGGTWEPYGIFEHLSKQVSPENLDVLLRLFNEQRILFYRFELWNRNEAVQNELVDRSPVTFLVSSENYRRSRERVAVCISGVARNYRQNLTLMRAFLADSNADVFFHFWESPEQELIVRELEPKGYEFGKRDDVPPPPEFTRREAFSTAERDGNSVAMFYGIKRANELRREYERANGFVYDVVIRLRLDFFAVTNLAELIQRIRYRQEGWENTLWVPNMAHSVGLNDQIALGTSSIMDRYASAYDSLDAFAASGDYFNPEYFLLRHVLGLGLKILTVPFEYVLLRSDTIDTFALEDHVRRTRETWWSAVLPDVPRTALTRYFEAKADSVYWVAELGLELPKVFRLRAPAQGYLRLDVERANVTFTVNADEASAFFLVVAGDRDRTAIDIRCRDLALENTGGGTGWNLQPLDTGAIRANGPSSEASAFFIARRGEQYTFEWRAGFWQRLRWAEASGGQDVGERLYLAADANGLRLAAGLSDAAAFDVERVNDSAAEAVSIGVGASSSATPARAADPAVVKIMWRSYVATRYLAEHGWQKTVDKTVEYLRRRSHAKARQRVR
ncbi:MAG: hypothetical protein JWM95_3791 [Gemmatimonadetes bacterium]|nr:hypothetical protein [Gemmatimonadota bacterium]